LKVAAVLPAEGLARFSLMPSQHPPRNVFLPLATLQRLLDKPGMANAILVAADPQTRPVNDAAQQALKQAFRPQLEDFGLRVEHMESPIEYVQISAERLVLPDEVVSAAERAFGKEQLQPVATYLANTLVLGDGDAQRKTPYSTITGIDSTAELGPLLDRDGQPITLADDEIALNRWAADDLAAQPGDRIAVAYYEPESTHGRLRERRPPPVFKLREIVELANADGEPTPAADPNLTPELAGVTDQASINEWDLPFELVEKIRPQDEDYWDQYRTAPKAFVSLATAKRLWSSRWGTISLLRLPAAGAWTARLSDQSGGTPDTRQVANRLARQIDPAALGMAFIPVKRLGLESAAGTTPFGALFLGFSFFLIAAAVMLIALLFQLGVQQRAGELGTLAAVGIPNKRIARLLSREGLMVAATGATLGAGFGVLYAGAMVAALRTWWRAAIATPFLELHVAWSSLAVGWLIGLAASWLAIRWCIARLLREPPARLVAGALAGGLRPPDAPARRGSLSSILRVALLLLLAALLAVGTQTQGETRAGVFFASGAGALVLLLVEINYRLRYARRARAAASRFSLARLSALNMVRHPTRSSLTIGLVAAASFLILAVSAFRLETSEAGTGGFDLLATSDLPIHFDLNTLEGRLELGFSDRASRQLENWRAFSLRMAGGEDASCLNLYRPTQPRVLGVSQAFIERGGFAWSAAANDTANPWRLLAENVGSDENGEPIVPVVLDSSTAIYSLHLNGVGSQLTIRDGADRPVTLQVVGLLRNSVLQGNLLMHEERFLRLFPDTAGYQFFMIERDTQPRGGPRRHPESGARSSPANPGVSAAGSGDVAQALEATLADAGFDAVDARQQLAAFLAVQNTYLSTFQSLGALGLLLGTVGLAAVQLRNLLERRGELALMRAAGFPRSRLTQLVVWENAVLLGGGLAVGCLAAIIALVPQWAPQDAAVPWLALASLLATIAIAGVLAGWLATRSALNAPILPALRGD
jgi:ABC-type antimicrobial peptide transport system permease subunit